MIITVVVGDEFGAVGIQTILLRQFFHLITLPVIGEPFLDGLKLGIITKTQVFLRRWKGERLTVEKLFVDDLGQGDRISELFLKSLQREEKSSHDRRVHISASRLEDSAIWSIVNIYRPDGAIYSSNKPLPHSLYKRCMGTLESPRSHQHAVLLFEILPKTFLTLATPMSTQSPFAWARSTSWRVGEASACIV